MLHFVQHDSEKMIYREKCWFNVTKSAALSINVHEMTGFGGEVAGKVPIIHQKGGFHGKVMGEMLFVHQNGSFDGETGLQERESGTKQGERALWCSSRSLL